MVNSGGLSRHCISRCLGNVQVTEEVRRKRNGPDVPVSADGSIGERALLASVSRAARTARTAGAGVGSCLLGLVQLSFDLPLQILEDCRSVTLLWSRRGWRAQRGRSGEGRAEEEGPDGGYQ